MRLESMPPSLAQNGPLGGTDMPVLWGYSALLRGRLLTQEQLVNW